jgi:hypothetical protein
MFLLLRRFMCRVYIPEVLSLPILIDAFIIRSNPTVLKKID